MDNSYKILEMLARADGALSGEEIGRKLNLSRTAVSKHIAKLRQMGFSIESVTNLGHLLHRDPALYNGYSLRLALAARGLDVDVDFLEETDSTNIQAKRAEYTAGEGIVAARRQTGGRGRKSRSFSSEAGGLYFSYYCRPKRLRPYDAAKAVLATGLAVARTLRSFGVEAGIKWPNDVLVGGRKICGILCEMISGADEVQKLVLGIGVNAENPLPPELEETATSLRLLGSLVPLASLCAEIAANLHENLEKLFQGRFYLVAAEYEKYSVTFGRTVNVVEEERTFTARAVGLDENGFLRVETENGNALVITGDVSIRETPTAER